MHMWVILCVLRQFPIVSFVSSKSSLTCLDSLASNQGNQLIVRSWPTTAKMNTRIYSNSPLLECDSIMYSYIYRNEPRWEFSLHTNIRSVMILTSLIQLRFWSLGWCYYLTYNCASFFHLPLKKNVINNERKCTFMYVLPEEPLGKMLAEGFLKYNRY